MYRAIFFLVFSNSLISLHGNEVYYLHQNLSYNQLQDKTLAWLPYEKQIYNGLDNGVYWFRVELSSSEQYRIIHFPESHITRGMLYDEGKEILPLENKRYLSFRVSPSSQAKTYYVKLDCFLDATIPLKIEYEQAYYQAENVDYVKIGLYFGVTLFILVVNLFSYFSFRNKTYLHYMFMVIGMAVNAFYKDGLFALLCGGSKGINEYLEPLLNAIVVISAIFFTSSYLNVKEYLPKWRMMGIFFVLLAVLLDISFCLTDAFMLFALADIFHLIALDVFWSCGILLWKRTFEARLFALAYGIPLFIAHGFYIFPHFGIDIIALPLSLYKAGSIFEMVFFTYAIMYQAKRITLENKKIRAKLIQYSSKIEDLQVHKKEISINELIKTYKLTLKEIDVLREVSLGKTNKQIGEGLFISENTVKYHIKNILSKLEVNTKKEAGKKFLTKVNKG